MNRFTLLLSYILLSLSCFSQKVSNEIILRTEASGQPLLRSIKALDSDISNVEMKSLCKTLDIYLLTIKTTSENDLSDKVISGLLQNPAIDYAYSNQMTNQRTTPNDTRYPNQWNLGLIKAEEAWEVTTGGQDVNGQDIVIAIMDDGFDVAHEDMQNNLWINPNEIIGDGIDNDFNGFIDDIHGVDLDSDSGNIESESHGTSVMGIAGADSNNGLGITGINWNAKVMVLSSVTNEAKVIAGYDYIYELRNRYNLSNGDNGAFVVATNYSLGIDDEFGDDHQAWCGMYDLLGSAGIVSVGATTNSNTNVDEEGDLPTTCGSNFFIGVTNTNRDDEKVTNAGYGLEHIDLSAPGRNTETLKPNNQYGAFAGTSASAPHVAGAIGLINAIPCDNLALFIKENPEESALRIRQSILNGVDLLSTLNGFTATGGRLNILKSMSDLSEFCSTDPTIPISGGLQIDFIRDENDGSYLLFYKSPDTRAVMVNVYNTQGQKVYSSLSTPGVFSRSSARIDMATMASGVYIATVSLGHDIASRKFRYMAN